MGELIGLAAVIGTVLASYAGGASALDFEFEDGARLNWNTTVSVGASFRAEEPSRWLYTRADGSLIGLYTPNLIPGTPVGPKDGLAGNHAAGDANLNFDKGDMFSAPAKIITDLEYKKGRWGALIRGKFWYDYALENNEVRVGSQANEYNGVRPHEALHDATPASVYERSPRPYPNTLPPMEYPAHYEVRFVSGNGGIRWHNGWVNVSHVLAGQDIGFTEIDDGEWDVYFGRVKIGRFHERLRRIEDAQGQLARKRVKV